MSATYAVSMVRNEADVIAGTLRHMADEVDHLIVADNGSTDGTREILDELARELPLTVVDDPDPAYYQSQKMTALAEKAAADGAVWIAPFDADEIWFSRLGRIRDVLAAAPEDIAHAPLVNHFATAIDPAGDDPFVTMQWRQREPGPLPKVAVRWRPGAVIQQGNHGATLPGSVAVGHGLLELRHFPYRSARQFATKAIQGAAAYRLTDLPADQGAHWRSYGEIADRFGPEALEDVYREHFWFFSPVDAGMVHDPAPYLRWRQ